jgi:hypothetical protein
VQFGTPFRSFHHPETGYTESADLIPYLGKRFPYPGELPIDLDPVAFLAVNHESYRIHMDDQWKSMFPKGYPLEPITDPSILPQRALVKVPALYNHLWCLNRLREIFMSPGWENDTCKDKQVHRCLNLVRQSMMCAGDSTLEPALDLMNEEGEPERSATGIDILHVCRDWTQIRNVTEQRFLMGHH